MDRSRNEPYSRAMQLSNQEALALVRQGVDALQQGRAADARQDLERVTRTGRANAWC